MIVQPILASNKFVNSDFIETTSYLNAQRLRGDNQHKQHNKPVHFNRLVEANVTVFFLLVCVDTDTKFFYLFIHNDK